MYSEDIACIEKLLIPVKRVLKQENLIKKDSRERRIRLWKLVRENFDKYVEGDCGRFLKDMDNHIHGQFSASLLILASSFKEKGETFDAAEYFSEKELNTYKKISQYTIFEILSPAEIRNKLELHDENIQDLLYDYYFSMDTWVNSTLNDSEINLGVRYYLKEKWGDYRRIINTALRQDQDVWMHLIIEYGKQHKDVAEPKTFIRNVEIKKKQEEDKPSQRARAEHEKLSVDFLREGVNTEFSQSEEWFLHHDIFISYSHEDKSVADAICATLESVNTRCWIAPRDVLPGQNYPSAIIQAIEQCRLMVMVFSSKSNNSDHVIRELTKAVSKGIIIIPFRIENVPPSQDMEYLIGIPHWLDALTPPLERHIEKLVQTVKVLLEKRK
jgi:hypothetical protein